MSVRINREKMVVAMMRAGLNVTQLAEKSGVSRVTISAIKAGKPCSIGTAGKLVSVLGSGIVKAV